MGHPQQRMPRVLFIGDIVGRPGRSFVVKNVAALKARFRADIVIANAENVAGGFGLTGATANELTEAGVDALTLGNHAWDQRGFDAEIEHLPRVCRPANMPHNNPGKTHLIIDKNGFRLGLFTVLGNSFMGTKSDCLFACADKLLNELMTHVDACIVEIHAETTGEKVALGWYLDGRVALVVGTHTHIPTADARILPGGTAYLTDAGMTGPYDSVIGCTKEPVIAKLLDGMPRRYTVATENIQLWGCLVDIDAATGKAVAFESVCVREADMCP